MKHFDKATITLIYQNLCEILDIWFSYQAKIVATVPYSNLAITLPRPLRLLFLMASTEMMFPSLLELQSLSVSHCKLRTYVYATPEKRKENQ